jgi:hypothetical protein
MSLQDDYFAIELDIDELMGKVGAYYDDLDEVGHLDKIRRSYRQYYGKGMDAPTHKVVASGSSGELSSLSVNNYRSLLRHQYTLVTSERLAFDVRPVNTDYVSMTQALLGNDVLEYYLTQKRLENILKRATEKSLWSSEGFVGLSWNANLGNVYEIDPETEEPVMEGDIEYRTYSTLDVIRDIYKEDEQDWLILRSFENKYELAASFSEFEEVILDLDTMSDAKKRRLRSTSMTNINSDMVDFYILYHRKSKALPEGKYAYFVDGQILTQGPLPYSEMPVYRITPAEFDGYCLGYTQGFDILGLQHAGDQLFEAVLSNNITFARQCIQGPKGADINVNNIADGMVYLEYDGDQPLQPVQLTQSSPETYKLMDRIDMLMEGQTGINEVVRGDPSANLRSGNSLALIAAQAIKFNSSLQYSYAKLTEDVGTATVTFLKDFANAPRFASVVGKHNKAYLKEFSSDKLQGASRVEVQMSSALSKTAAGRIEMANNLLQNGLIKRPEQYLMVLETGKLDPIVEAEQSELLNIKAENERLKEGTGATALIIDDHRLHILEHKSVVNDPDARDTPELMEATLAHIMEHMDLWKQLSANPELAMALGFQPIQPAPPQGMPQEGAPPEQGTVPPSEGMPPEVLAQENPAEAVNMPNMPSMPAAAAPEDVAAYEQMNLT